jgi:hypothetical protein
VELVVRQAGATLPKPPQVAILDVKPIKGCAVDIPVVLNLA